MKKLLTLCLSLLLALSFPALASRTLPYTIDLTAGTSVHAGPGKEYERALTLDEDGVFTIVEETLGADDEFWGKLKSGAGWVQITFRVDEPSRTVSLSAGTAVRTGPGSQYDLAQTIDEDGVFTIVEESYDSNINLWGRLKSGAGWVFLQSEQTLSVAPMRAHYAEDVSLQSEPIHIIADTSEYAVDIVFIPNEDIRDIVFSSLQPTDIDYEVVELLFSTEELSAYTPLLASVAFPGDMSAYGLAFTDAGGNFRRYTVSISGKDGMLELTEQY